MTSTNSPYRLAHVRDQITEAFSHSIAADEVLASKGAPTKGTAAGELAIAVRELGNALAGLTEKVEFLLTEQARRDTVAEMNKPFYAGKEYREKQAELRRRVEALERQRPAEVQDTAAPATKAPTYHGLTEQELRQVAEEFKHNGTPVTHTFSLTERGNLQVNLAARPPDKVEVIVHQARTDVLGSGEYGTATVGVKVTLDGRQYGTYAPVSARNPYERVNDLLYTIERLCRQMRQGGYLNYELVEGMDPPLTELA